MSYCDMSVGLHVTKASLLGRRQLTKAAMRAALKLITALAHCSGSFTLLSNVPLSA